MSIFNSLGSNHSFASALRILFAFGGTSARGNLIKYLESRYGGTAIITYKGREALRLALASILGEKGSIAVHGFTCWAVYQAVQESGHTCHYVDISRTSLNFSVDALRAALTADSSIKAVVIQNTLGVPCDIDAVAALCKERGVALVEDLAHSIGAVYQSGQEVGTAGDFVVLSFSQDKVIDAIAGGALIVRNKKYQGLALPSYKKVARTQQLKDRFYPLFTSIIRSTHTIGIGPIIHRVLKSARMLSRPLDDKDTGATHELPGWYCATVLHAYNSLEKTAQHRREIAQVYAEKVDKRLQVTDDVRHIARSANLRFPILHNDRDHLIEHLKSKHVYVGDIWYDAPVGPKRYLHRTDYRGECPQAEEVSAMMLNLPTHAHVSKVQAERIAAFVNQFPQAEGDAPYRVKPVQDKRVWEDFLESLKPHSFLQSWKWGQHYGQTGSKVFRVGVFKSGTLVGVALLIKIQARRGHFLVCPHGPLIAYFGDEEGALSALVRYASDVARDEECDFIRFCPISAATDANRAMYRRLGFSDAPIHMHPELSWVLDITKPEEQLLKEMRKTTRYTIKKMEKEGVEIVQSSDPADMEKFWLVYTDTFERQQFTPFSKNYLRTEFELYRADNEAMFFFGKYQGEIVAAAIIIFYNGQAFYHHSGSLAGGGSNVSYLLQWRVIQEAKRRGCTLYNFWGIAPDDKPKHAWTGLSQFKKGFGGFAEAYLHAQDKPLSPRYVLNYAIETVRRIRRRL